jgi:hypothetical protein
VSYALKRTDPSPKDTEAIEGLSRAIVDGVLRGPIAAVTLSISAEAKTSEDGGDSCAS